MEEKGLLDAEHEVPRGTAADRIEIYKMQRSHFTKLVETLYRIIPFYIAIVGAIWAYGFSLRAKVSLAGDDWRLW